MFYYFVDTYIFFTLSGRGRGWQRNFANQGAARVHYGVLHAGSRGADMVCLDLSNDINITVNPPFFSLANTFKTGPNDWYRFELTSFSLDGTFKFLYFGFCLSVYFLRCSILSWMVKNCVADSLKHISTLIYSAFCLLKGTVSRDFRLLFFSWISFPQASEYFLAAISNFFENSRRYSRLKVHHRCQRHRWQMEKIFKHLLPLGSRINIYVNWCLQVHFNYGGDKGNCWQICHRCRWHLWCTLNCEYLREFSKKFEMILVLLSGDWGKLIHEKNLKQKISWYCPFKCAIFVTVKGAWYNAVFGDFNPPNCANQ